MRESKVAAMKERQHSQKIELALKFSFPVCFSSMNVLSADYVEETMNYILEVAGDLNEWYRRALLAAQLHERFDGMMMPDHTHEDYGFIRTVLQNILTIVMEMEPIEFQPDLVLLLTALLNDAPNSSVLLKKMHL